MLAAEIANRSSEPILWRRSQAAENQQYSLSESRFSRSYDLCEAYAFWQKEATCHFIQRRELAQKILQSPFNGEEITSSEAKLGALLFHISTYTRGRELIAGFLEWVQESTHPAATFRHLSRAHVSMDGRQMKGPLPLGIFSSESGISGGSLSELRASEFRLFLATAISSTLKNPDYVRTALSDTLLVNLEEQRISFLSYNLGVMPPLFKPFQPFRRITIPTIGKAILKSDTDCVVLQEAWAPHVREILLLYLRKRYHVLLGDKLPLFLGCSGLVTLVSRRFTILETRLIPFSTTQGFEHLSKKGSFEVVFSDGKRSFSIQNIHALSPKEGSLMKHIRFLERVFGACERSEERVRQNQFVEVSERMKDRTKEGHVSFALGDFNSTAETPILGEATDLYRARYPLSETEAAYLPERSNLLGNTWIRSNHRTRGGLEVDSRLDRAFVHLPEGFSGGVGVDGRVLYDWPWSDHYPLLTDVRFLQ